MLEFKYREFHVRRALYVTYWQHCMLTVHAVTRPPHLSTREGGRELAGDAVLVFHDLGLDGT